MEKGLGVLRGVDGGYIVIFFIFLIYMSNENTLNNVRVHPIKQFEIKTYFIYPKTQKPFIVYLPSNCKY